MARTTPLPISNSKRLIITSNGAIVAETTKAGNFDAYLPLSCPNWETYRKEVIDLLARFIVFNDPKKVADITFPKIRNISGSVERKPRTKTKIDHTGAADSWAKQIVRNLYVCETHKMFVNLHPALVIFPWKLPTDLTCMHFLGNSGNFHF